MIDVSALRELVRDAVRDVLDERRPEPDTYLSVARAAEVAEVAPSTVRAWVADGRLGRYRAGRELRVKRSDLDRLLSTGWGSTDESEDVLAARILNR